MATWNSDFENTSKERSENYYISLEDLQIGTCLRGVVTHVEDPLTFYIQFENQKRHLFLNLLDDLQHECSETKSSLNVNLNPGLCYAVKVKDTWCRVLIEEVLNENKCSIFLFDTGSRQVADSTVLRPLPDCYLAVPPQASRCKLASVIPCNELSQDILTRHKVISEAILGNCIITVFIESYFVGQVGHLHQGESTLYVTAYAGADLWSVNKQLSFGGYFKSIKEHEQPWHQEIRATLGPSIIKVELGMSKIPQQTPPTTDETKEIVLEKENCLTEPKIDSAPPARLSFVEKLGSLKAECPVFRMMPTSNNCIIPVKFLVCLYPTIVFFRPVTYIKLFLQLQDQLHKTYQNFEVKERGRFDIGTWCAVLLEGRWIRAVILDYDEHLFCSVFCVDLGLSCRVSIHHVLPLIEPFVSIPKLALKCSLARVEALDAKVFSKIYSILIGANDIYLSRPHRPIVMPSIMSVDVIYRSHNGKLVNLNDQLIFEKVFQNLQSPIVNLLK